jgi:DNA-binding NarL/FixJ family response regulator
VGDRLGPSRDDDGRGNQPERQEHVVHQAASLTDREREVLEMVAVGKGNATIAHELMISLKTVRNHVSNVFTKLQVSNRSAAIVKAREAGLGGS